MITSRLRILTLILMIVVTTLSVAAQRRVTPVNPPKPGQVQLENKPKEIDRTRLAERLDAQGNIILVDTVTGLEFVDSAAIRARARNIYPRMQSIDVGIDVWDPVMRALGQKYGLASAYVRLSMYNRFFPLFEAGLGAANITPDGANFTFKSPTSPFFKIGADYNVFYNNSPDYCLLTGLRYGFTPYKWSVDNATIPGGYWQDPTTFSIPTQSATVGFLEISIGVRVKIAGPISAGWQFKFRKILHESKNEHGEPMYIPGFGKKSAPVNGAFSIIYTLPLNRGKSRSVDIENTDTSTSLPPTLSED